MRSASARGPGSGANPRCPADTTITLGSTGSSTLCTMGCVNQRATGLAALVAAASVLVAACGGPDEPAPTTTTRSAESATLKRITDRGKIIIGLRADTPGLAHRDPVSGTFGGFEVELAKLIATGLGLKPEQIAFTALTPDTALPSVAAGTVDIYLGGSTPNQAKQAGLLAAG